MKLLLLVVLVALCSYASAIEYTLENCKCGSQYKAEADSNGKVQCTGKLLDHIMPCNIPEAPRCICTENEATGILTDNDGTWCLVSEEGVQKKKWPCENTAEWDAYNIAYENYKKTLTQ